MGINIIKWAYISPISKHRDEKFFFRFFDISLYFFLTGFILSDQADKDMDRWEFYGLSENEPMSHRYPNSATKNKNFDFYIFFFFF